MREKDAPRRRTRQVTERQRPTPKGRRTKIGTKRGESAGAGNALEDKDAKGYSRSYNSVIVIHHLSGLIILLCVREHGERNTRK